MKAGLVGSFGRPGSNVTGVSLLTPELSGKRLQLLSNVKAARALGLTFPPALLRQADQIID